MKQLRGLLKRRKRKKLRKGRKFFALLSILVSVSLIFSPLAVYADNPEPICPQAENTVVVPVFNVNTGYCEVPPLTPDGQCPTGYVYSYDINRCVSIPTCPSGYIYNKDTHQCEEAETDFLTGGYYLDENSYYCAVDLNSDGDIEQNELEECVQASDGSYVCPLDEVACNVQDQESYSCECHPQKTWIFYNVRYPYSTSGWWGTIKCSGLTCTVCNKNADFMYVEPGNCERAVGLYKGQCVTLWFDSANTSFVYAVNYNCNIPACLVKSGCRLWCGRWIRCYKILSSVLSCPSGTVLIDGKCMSCPYGSEYPCKNVGGQWICSKTKCYTPSSAIKTVSSDIIPSGLQDDASYDAMGRCLGSIYIFNGQSMRCRHPGVQTGFQNCCNEADGKVYDNFGGMSGSFETVKDAVAAIYASFKLAKLGYYAAKIASGEYVLQAPLNTYYLLDSQGNIVATFESGSPEALALSKVTPGMDPDQAVGTFAKNYISQGAIQSQIVVAILNIAASQLIDDPSISAAVNIASQMVLYAMGAIGPVGLAVGIITTLASLFMGNCDRQDVITSTLKESGRCHYIGEKCIEKWEIGGCVQKEDVYCCFNSKLARIIQEQGRKQLGISWGDADNPNCRGFTPEEFQALDFSQMDLSEYYQDIQQNIRTNIQPLIENQINETFNALK